jgi:hypothetical protein
MWAELNNISMDFLLLEKIADFIYLSKLTCEYIGCFFKFHLVVGVEESIMNAPHV